MALVLVATYWLHLQRLRGSGGEQFARDGWLKNSYFHANTQSLAAFLGSATKALFEYVFANDVFGQLMIIAFLAGLALMLIADGASHGSTPVLAFLLPVVLTAAAGTLMVYPYGGSRHDAFLAVYLALPISVALAYLIRGGTYSPHNRPPACPQLGQFRHA